MVVKLRLKPILYFSVCFALLATVVPARPLSGRAVSSALAARTSSSRSGSASGSQTSASTSPPAKSTDSIKCIKPKRSPSKTNKPDDPGNPVPNQFIVTLKKDTDIKKHLEKVKEIIQSTAGCDKNMKSAVASNSFLSKIFIYGILLNPTGIAELKKDKEIKKMVEDVYVETDSQIVSGNFSKRVNLLTHKTVQNAPWSHHRLNTKKDMVEEAGEKHVASYNWPFSYMKEPGKGIDVYVIDTGVNDHEDYKGRLKAGKNTERLGGVPSTETADNVGHGTRMAGIIAGTRYGIAKEANIIPIKAGNTGALTQLSILSGIGEATIDARDEESGKSRGVINISAQMLRGKGDGMETAVKLAVDLGMQIVGSAGNRGTNACAERIGSDDGIILVGNSNIHDKLGSWSNWGPCVDVFAPGTDVPTPDYKSEDGILEYQAGTSEAAALTSGLVATLLGKNKDMTPAAMKAKIKSLAVEAMDLGEGITQTTRLIAQAP